MNNWVFTLLVMIFLISFILVFIIYKFSLKFNILMDEPNLRSSHKISTPRGGGMAIAVAFLFGVSLFYFILNIFDDGFYIAVLGSASMIAIVGFLDDFFSISVKLRLVVQGVCAGWILYFIQRVPELEVFGGWVIPSWLVYILGGFGIVWLINLYNFMDGIDGIASFEAISVSLAGAILYWLAGDLEQIYKPLLLAAATAGFAIWNFPVAKIFMGDGGSGFLGLMMALLAIDAGLLNPNLFWAWMIMLGVFIVDASFTLAHRMLQGAKLYEAHRSHAYQIAAQRAGAHAPITLAIILINILWLLPLAVSVVMNYVDGVLGVLLAYIPLVLLAGYLGAGSKAVGGISHG